MALDKAALESLRRDRDTAPDAGKYRQRGGSRRKLWYLLAGLAVVAAVIAWRTLSGPVPVQTVTVESSTSANGAVLNASGYVVARRLATVSSKVTGQVTEVLFEEGAEVDAGQVLARLDRSTIAAELKVLVSGAEAQRRNLREIEVRLADARQTLERNRSLVERRLVAQSLVDSAAAEVAALTARLAAARAEVGVADAQVELGQQALADLDIRAPFKGIVISKDAQPGEIVSPMSAGGGFTRTGVATIVDMDSREVEVDVNESYINRVSPGQKVECVLDAYPDLRFAAHVVGIVPTADRQKATVRVRIGFDELDPRILPDMGIKVSFLEDAAPSGNARPTLVPEAAVVTDADTNFVWVIADGKAVKRAVTVGPAKEGQVPVTEGLEGGETVVVDAPQRLREGAAVELQAAS
jgi:RND family efflux transporter MFP subunit